MEQRETKFVQDRPLALTITGVKCGGCVEVVKRVLAKVPGVSSVEVELDTGRAVIEGSAGHEDLVRAVQRAGYQAGLS